MKLLKLLAFISILFSANSFAVCVNDTTATPVDFRTVQCSDKGEAYAYVSDTARQDQSCAYTNGHADSVRQQAWSVYTTPYNENATVSGSCHRPPNTNDGSAFLRAYSLKNCGTREPEIIGDNPPEGSLFCKNGCLYITGGPTPPPNPTSAIVPTAGVGGAGETCTEGDSCPNGLVRTESGFCSKPDRDKDGVPDQDDAFPDDPNESVDSDNDGVGDNGDIAPNDDQNGKDDGRGDESDNTSTGGGDCKTPPVSKGDAILASIAYQTWSTRCQAEKGNAGVVTGDPTICNAAYTCTGDAIQCAQVALLRKNSCTNVTSGNAQPDWTRVTNGGITPDSTPSPNPNTGDSPIGLDAIDDGGILSNRSCPQLGAVNLGMFGTYSLDGYAWTCDILQIVRLLIIMMGAYTALRILMGDSDA